MDKFHIDPETGEVGMAQAALFEQSQQQLVDHLIRERRREGEILP